MKRRNKNQLFLEKHKILPSLDERKERKMKKEGKKNGTKTFLISYANFKSNFK